MLSPETDQLLNRRRFQHFPSKNPSFSLRAFPMHPLELLPRHSNPETFAHSRSVIRQNRIRWAKPRRKYVVLTQKLVTHPRRMSYLEGGLKQPKSPE